MLWGKLHARALLWSSSFPLLLLGYLLPPSVVLLFHQLTKSLLTRFARKRARERFEPNKIERRDMLGAFLRHGMEPGEAERAGILQLSVCLPATHRGPFVAESTNTTCSPPAWPDLILSQLPCEPRCFGLLLVLLCWAGSATSCMRPAFYSTGRLVPLSLMPRLAAFRTSPQSLRRHYAYTRLRLVR
jgi:hypothetical protein